jgi:YggT family protein
MNANPLGLLCDAVQIYYLILIVRIILSWVPQLPEPVQPVANVVRALTDPVMRPFRNLIPPVRIGMAALDLSPIILFLILSLFVRPLVCTITGGGFFL